jgi:hypothetical protein
MATAQSQWVAVIGVVVGSWWAMVASARAGNTFTRTFGAADFGGAHQGIAVGPSGDCYASGQRANRILVFSSTGAFVEDFGWGVSDGQLRPETRAAVACARPALAERGQVSSRCRPAGAPQRSWAWFSWR